MSKQKVISLQMWRLRRLKQLKKPKPTKEERNRELLRKYKERLKVDPRFGKFCGRVRNIPKVLLGTRLEVPPLSHIKKPKKKKKPSQLESYDVNYTWNNIAFDFLQFNDAMVHISEEFKKKEGKGSKNYPPHKEGEVSYLDTYLDHFVNKEATRKGECKFSRFVVSPNAAARTPYAQLPRAVVTCLRSLNNEYKEWRSHAANPSVPVTWLVCHVHDITPPVVNATADEVKDYLLHNTCGNVGCINPLHLEWKIPETKSE